MRVEHGRSIQSERPKPSGRAREKGTGHQPAGDVGCVVGADVWTAQRDDGRDEPEQGSQTRMVVTEQMGGERGR